LNVHHKTKKHVRKNSSIFTQWEMVIMNFKKYNIKKKERQNRAWNKQAKVVRKIDLSSNVFHMVV
jgi:hypothetical protein